MFTYYYVMAEHAVLEHREARKEFAKLSRPIRQRFDIIRADIEQDPRAAALNPRKETGWGKRTMLGYGFAYHGTTYRIAWELDALGNAYIWSYGPHEGFWAKVAKRAGR